MPCFTAMRAEIARMSGSAFAVTHHAFSSGAGRTSDGNGSHASTLKSPSYTKSVSWQHYQNHQPGLILTTKRQIFAMLTVLYKSAIRSRHHKYTDTENHYVYLLSGRKFNSRTRSG
ncbi:putative transposase [Shigella flexneri K-315]|uniref:Putative transposase n=1 Tax=Shigella flexneri K-315 TaxID=766150 RepID=I6CQ77_SHIFL|nr:putative transposase [Shigella flexneri K-315]